VVLIFAAAVAADQPGVKAPPGRPGAPGPGPWREGRALKGFAADAGKLVFSSDGKSLVAVYGDGSLKQWEVATGKEQASLRTDPTDRKRGSDTHGGNFWALSPDLKLLARGRADGSVYLWDVASAKRVGSLSGHAGPVISLAFSPDGRSLVTGSHDNSLRLWDLDKKTLRAVFPDCTAMSLAFTPDGKTLVANRVRYKIFTPAQIKAIRDLNRKGGNSTTITGRNPLYVVGRNYWFTQEFLPDLLLLDAATLKPSKPALAMKHPHTINLWPTPKGQALVVTFDPRTAKMLDTESFQEIGPLPPPVALTGRAAWTPDGKRLAAAANWRVPILPIRGDARFKSIGRVVFHDPAKGTLLASIEKGTEAMCVALSPDGKTLAASVRLTGRGGPRSLEYRVQLWHDKSQPVPK
jgi:WD40 repeat protein